jgi:limonene-1,2-epoxide hydrolase
MSVVARNDDERAVLELFAAWETGDVDRVMAWFTPDARFLNAANPDMPGSPKEGSEAIRELIESEMQTRAIRIEPHRICSGEDGWVFAERTDWMRPTEGVHAGEWVGFPITGVLQVRDGKVAEWREYFDLAVVVALLAPAEETDQAQS